MAKQKVPGYIGDVTGQIGEVIISKYLGKKVVKKKGIRKDNHTKPRMKTMGNFGKVALEWNDLTRVEKKQWHHFSRMGYFFKNRNGEVIKTGKGYFFTLNLILAEAEEPIIRVPLPTEMAQNINKMTIDIKTDDNNPEIIMKYQGKINPETKIIISASSVITGETDEVNDKKQRVLSVKDHNFKSGTSIKAEYLKVYKTMPEEGDEIYFKVRSVNKKSGLSNITYIPVEAKKGIKSNKNRERTGKEPRKNRERTIIGML